MNFYKPCYSSVSTGKQAVSRLSQLPAGHLANPPPSYLWAPRQPTPQIPVGTQTPQPAPPNLPLFPCLPLMTCMITLSPSWKAGPSLASCPQISPVAPSSSPRLLVPLFCYPGQPQRPPLVPKSLPGSILPHVKIWWCYSLNWVSAVAPCHA